jgi:predicted nucleic acid-binding protein
VARVIVLDACVLAAFADPDHSHHRPARSIMARPEPFALSALTGAEVMVPNAHHQPQPGLWAALFADFGIRVIDLASADMAPLATLRAATRLRMPDAIVLYTAISCGASVATFDAALSRAAGSCQVGVIDR